MKLTNIFTKRDASDKKGDKVAPRQLSAFPEGIHVGPTGCLKVSADSAVLSLSSGATHTVSIKLVEGGGLQIRTESVLAADAQTLRDERNFTLEKVQEARDFFQGQIRDWALLVKRPTPWEDESSHAASRGASHYSTTRKALLVGAGFIAGAVAVVAASLVITQGDPALDVVGSAPYAQQGLPSGGWPSNVALLPPPPAPDLSGEPLPADPREMPNVTDGAAGAKDAVAQMQNARLSSEEFRLVTKAASIKLKSATHTLIAFSDPLCPACQDLEQQAARLGDKFGVAVIPVAFKQGSRAIAASALCSRNPAKTWADAMRGIRPTNAPCDKGFAQVDANSELFARIGASATPTIVAPNGQLAAGSADTPILEKFVLAYLK